MRFLVISVLLYACETWTLTADILKKLHGTEQTTYRNHITDDAVRDRIRQVIRPYGDILTTVKKRKLKWIGLVSRSTGLARKFYKEQCKGGEEEKRCIARNITGLRFCDALREAENRVKWRLRVAKSVVPQLSPWLRNRCRCRFTSPIKRRLREFYVVVVRCRQRIVQKQSVLYMQSSCFAYQTYCFFDVAVAVAVVVAKADVVGDNKRQLNEGNEALHRKGYH